MDRSRFRRAAVPALAALAVAVTAFALAANAPATGGGRRASARDPNPCIGPQAAKLLCPDLRISPPYDLAFDHVGGRLVLRATSSLNNVGRGPAQLFGRRIRRDRMSAVQQIRRVGGGWLTVHTGARLGWKWIPGQYGYWKWIGAARFELWSLHRNGSLNRLVRVGPKVLYCLRDLFRTHPRPASPPERHYPACSQDRGRRSVTLGTSVGWSDIYPSTYFQQWIDVTGLHGRFGYVMIADPRNGIYESNEHNNRSMTIVRIP